MLPIDNGNLKCLSHMEYNIKVTLDHFLVAIRHHEVIQMSKAGNRLRRSPCPGLSKPLVNCLYSGTTLWSVCTLTSSKVNVYSVSSLVKRTVFRRKKIHFQVLTSTFVFCVHTRFLIIATILGSSHLGTRSEILVPPLPAVHLRRKQSPFSVAFYVYKLSS